MQGFNNAIVVRKSIVKGTTNTNKEVLLSSDGIANIGNFSTLLDLMTKGGKNLSRYSYCVGLVEEIM